MKKLCSLLFVCSLATMVSAYEFSVSPTTKVVFAPGNLQYCPNPESWRFADQQWTVVLNKPGNSEYGIKRGTQTAWVDLYGWGTSGCIKDNRLSPIEMTTYSSNIDRYGPAKPTGASPYPSLVYDNTYGTVFANYDWGIYNDIDGNGPGYWRTLEKSEWEYLLGLSTPSRPNAANLYTWAAKVHGVPGMIIWPDDLDQTTKYLADGTPGSWQVVSDAMWSAYEALGACFLPAGGFQNGEIGGSEHQMAEYSGAQQDGCYWTATAEGTTVNCCALDLNFYDGDNGVTGTSFSLSFRYPRHMGFSVRLVHDGSNPCWVNVSDRPADESKQIVMMDSHRAAAKSINVRLTRTLQGGLWNTICLPFDVESSEWRRAFGENVEIYKFDGLSIVNEDTTELSLSMIPFGQYELMRAGVAYIVVPEQSVVNPCFYNCRFLCSSASGETLPTSGSTSFLGIINRTQLTPGDKKYLFVTGTDELKWSRSNDTGRMYGMRAYFFLGAGSPAPARARMVVGVAEHTESAEVATSLDDNLNVSLDARVATKILQNGRIVLRCGNRSYLVNGQLLGD